MLPTRHPYLMIPHQTLPTLNSATNYEDNQSKSQSREWQRLSEILEDGSQVYSFLIRRSLA